MSKPDGRRRTLLSIGAAVFGGLVLLAGCGGTKITTQRLAELKARNADLLELEIPGTERRIRATTDDEQKDRIRNSALRVTLTYRPTSRSAEDLKVEIIAILEEAGWIFEPHPDFAPATRGIDRVVVAVVKDSSGPRVSVALAPQLKPQESG